MKIKRFYKFIKESVEDVDTDGISTELLNTIKVRIDSMFSEKEESDEDEGVSENLSDLGLELISSEISTANKLRDRLEVKYQDEAFEYHLFITLNIEDISDDIKGIEDADFEDVDRCRIKMKKYDKNTYEIMGQLTKNIEIKELTQDYIIELKVEIDEKYEEGEEFSIEYDL